MDTPNENERLADSTESSSASSSSDDALSQDELSDVSGGRFFDSSKAGGAEERLGSDVGRRSYGSEDSSA